MLSLEFRKVTIAREQAICWILGLDMLMEYRNHSAGQQQLHTQLIGPCPASAAV
jgi:hypothetical protein